MDEPTCTIDGCHKRSRNKATAAMCGMHYARWYSRGTTDPYVRPKKELAPSKVCTKCKEAKPSEQFYPVSWGDGRASQCSDCQKQRTREWSARNKERGALVNLSADYSKACSKCAELTPADGFYPLKSAIDGLESWCSKCVRAKRREDSARNRARETAYTRRWREQNRHKYDAYMSAWRAENKDRMREAARRWNSANAEHLADLKRRWTRDNYEAIMMRRRERWPEVQEINRRSARKNRDKRAARAAERRAKVMGGNVTQFDLDLLWTGNCGLCGDPIDRALRWPEPMSKSIDHVIPLSLGGDHTPENVQWAHLFCNISKGNRV